MSIHGLPCDRLEWKAALRRDCKWKADVVTAAIQGLPIHSRRIEWRTTCNCKLKYSVVRINYTNIRWQSAVVRQSIQQLQSESQCMPHVLTKGYQLKPVLSLSQCCPGTSPVFVPIKQVSEFPKTKPLMTQKAGCPTRFPFPFLLGKNERSK